MWFVIGTYVVLVFALPIGVGAAMGYRGLPVGRACPHCGNGTLQLVSHVLSRCSWFVPGVLQRRWCMCCGWEGTVRLPRPVQRERGARVADAAAADAGAAPAGPEAEAAPDDATPHGVDGSGLRRRGEAGASPATSADRAQTQTLDVRSLTLDGTPWRVMLQCWRTTGCYYGRFVFVAPSGRLWLDSIEAFTGASEHEVLGQALSLPDLLLATRLRRLVADT